MRVVGLIGIALLLSVLPATALRAGVISANPSNYQTLLGGLNPGDTLNLAAGTYPRLSLDGLNGAPGAFITIQGPASGAPAVITVDPGNPVCCNVVQLDSNSYLALKNLRVDSGLTGMDGVNSRGVTHDILVENCTFVGQGADQLTVAINTKGTAWNWVIRGNTITQAGTGMYLGNSDGTFPFINGLVEGNLTVDTIGYTAEFKYQIPYALPAGLDAGPHRTIIRNNVWVKTIPQSAWPPGAAVGARPNLLVGGFPASGPGSGDMYEIYGNFFFDNEEGESLFQGSGVVSMHDNVFVGGSYRAMSFQDHDLPLSKAYAYNNTVYGNVTGISVSGGSIVDALVTGNLIFAASGVSVPVAGMQKDNIATTMANAGTYVNLPSLTPGAMDFYPKTGSAAKGAALDMSKFILHTDYALDFNGTSKGTFLYRGAYAGEGTNPGWALKLEKKASGPPVPAPAAPKNLRIR